jgi:trimeric autotransporter adhesin
MRNGSSGSDRALPASRLACIFGLLLAVAPPVASAKSILVIAPHEDDEIFLAAGVARAAKARGDTVKMVLVTNGDVNGVSTGLAREENSVTAAQTIGLAEEDVIFLGYGDGSLGAIFRAGSGSQVFTSSAGQTATYGNRGLGGLDYHRYLHGVPGPYSRDTLLADLRDLLINFLPDEIYVASYFDDHDDHMATALLVVEAILSVQRSGVNLPVKLFQGIVWAPGAPSPWPQVESTGFTPWLPFYKPSCCFDTATPFEWERLQHVMVPPEMQTSDRATSLKWRAIQAGFGAYPWYSSFARREEIFWVTDFGANLATRAQVSVSSADVAGGRGKEKAVDGVLHGSPVGGVQEWATSGQLSGAWIQLDWPSPVSVAQVNLYDRPSLSQNVLGGILSFSDGSTIAVDALPPGGQVRPVTFPPKQVGWVRFTVTLAGGTSAGLSEIEVLGKQAGATANSSPHVLAGPGGASELSVPGGQSITLHVSAHDLEGDPLEYAWWTEAGTITGNGPTATLTAPNATAEETVAYSVTVLDGAGGTTTAFGFLKVTPGSGTGGGGSGGTDSLTVAPTSVTAGSTARGTVSLASVAPSSGQTVSLSSSNVAVASVPATVSVPAGATTASFTVTTASVSSTSSVTLVATIGGAARTASLQVTPAAATSGTNLAPAARISVSSESTQFFQDGVKAVDGIVDGYDGDTVGLPGDETKEWSTRGELAGAWIQLDWTPSIAVQRVVLYDRPNAADQVLTGALRFSDGSTVAVGALPNDAKAFIVDFPLRTISWVRFTVDQAVGRNIGLAEIQVFGASAPPDTLSVAPSTVVAGDPALGTITLGTAAPAGGQSVALTSSNVAVASLPASVTVAAGSATATFPVATFPVASTTNVTVSAALPGGARSAVLTVTARPVVADLAAVSLNPATVIGGQNVQATVTLSAAAGASGFTCQLSSSNGSLAGVPPSVVVPAGAISASFTVSTAVVAAGTSVTITTSTSSTSVSAPLSIQPLALTGLSLTPASVAGGATSQGAFTLSGIASGTVVALSSSDPSTVSVPTAVTVGLGAPGGTFPVTTTPVATDRTVTLTATVGTSSRSATLAVTAVSLSSVALVPSSVPGGGTSTGTVTLSGPAPASGSVVLLSSPSPAAAVPASVTVAAGATTAAFPVTTSPVSSSRSVVLTAALGAVARTATLTVNAPGLSSVALTPTTVVGGGASTGTVSLAGAAPTGGALIALGSSSSSASVPGSVTVPAGSNTATFPVKTSQVTSTRSATITAAYGGTTRTASLTVQRISVSGLTLYPASLPGGAFSRGTVTLSAAAAGSGFVVTLASSNAGAAVVPATVTVPAGSTTVTFPISTGVVAITSSPSISAAGGGASRTATLTVSAGPAPLALTLAPTSVVGPGTSLGTVTLNGPAGTSGTVVTLSSSNTSVATVPSSVTVPAGGMTASFPVTARQVSSSTTASISARAAGLTKRATLQVTP